MYTLPEHFVCIWQKLKKNFEHQCLPLKIIILIGAFDFDAL